MLFQFFEQSAELSWVGLRWARDPWSSARGSSRGSLRSQNPSSELAWTQLSWAKLSWAELGGAGLSKSELQISDLDPISGSAEVCSEILSRIPEVPKSELQRSV